MPGLTNRQDSSDSESDDEMPDLINHQNSSESDDESDSHDSHRGPRRKFNRNESSDDGAQGNNSDKYLSFGSESDQDIS